MSSNLPPLPEPFLELFRELSPHVYAAWADQLRSYGEACAAAEREAIIRIIEAYKVPIGNSCSGELAAEWTMDALRDVRDAIRARGET